MKSATNIKTAAAIVLGAMLGLRCWADAWVIAPTLGPFEFDTNKLDTLLPFLIKETVPSGGTEIPTMRYQQVYDRSLFTNVDPRFIYVSTITFYMGPRTNYLYCPFGWTIPSMQINLSTTAKDAQSLSSVFSQNVGADETIVLGPRSWSFPGGCSRADQLVLLDRPFGYDPRLGNLLLDVRVFDGSGARDFLSPPTLWAYNSPTDEVARVWSTNVTAVSADGSDTIGLLTLIELSAVPSLRAEFFTSYAGGRTNVIKISWPSEPTTFVLQTTDRLGVDTSWRDATNQVFGSPGGDSPRWILIPASSAGSAGFFRLIWAGGSP